VNLLRARRTLVPVVAALVLTACSGDERGGASSLPGAVPTGISFPQPDPSAPPAPEFSLVLVDGTPVTGSELWRERPLVLSFFASWCSQCVDQQAELDEVAEQTGDAVVILGIAGEDTESDVAAFLDELEVPYAAAIDDDLSTWRSYGVREPPHVVVIAKGGRVIRGWPGVTTAKVISDALIGLINEE
jgi:peroxiredoxin